METTTHRELLTWIEWWKVQDGTPTQTEFYLMQIAKEIRASNPEPKRAADLDLNTFKLKVEYKKPEKPLSRLEALKQRAMESKKSWMSALGLNKKSNNGSQLSRSPTHRKQ